MQTRNTLAALAVSALFITNAAHAGDFGQHPAVLNTKAPQIDASTLMYGHPASPLNRGGHANFQHPAVAQRGATPDVDAAALMYGHPASPLNGTGAESVNLASNSR